jgi:DUF4097 and DUF4098 domain-containing protein YvlB
MKKKVLAVILLIVAAAVVGSMTRSAEPLTGDASDAQQSKEIRESYKLQPGAEVLVSGINGKVEIETGDTDTAEIFIERNARNPEELSRRQIIIEHTDSSLTVRGERKSSGFWSFLTEHGNASEHVMLKLPRKISLEARGVNGHVNVGEVDGNVRISGVNGKVEVAQTSGYDEISGVNGAVTIAVKQLGERGLRISGVNGRVELRLRDGLNADLQAKGMNGGVNSEMPEVSIQKDNNRNYSARIGSGGAPISLSGINGGVKLTRDSV